MKNLIRILFIMITFSLILAYVGCAPKAPKTEPEVTEPAEIPQKLDLPKDKTMYKAYWVLAKYGRRTQRHMSYERYKKNTGGDPTAPWSPDWFYDSFEIPMNEKGHWITVNFHTARGAIKDARIRKLMENVAQNSIDIRLQLPNGRKYLLTDTEADGVLDFAAPVTRRKPQKELKVDFELLKQMQKKYTWILGLIKKSYQGKK